MAQTFVPEVYWQVKPDLGKEGFVMRDRTIFVMAGE